MRVIHLTFLAIAVASFRLVALEPVSLAWATADQLLAKTQTCNPVSTGRYVTRDSPAASVPVCRSGSAFFWHAGMSIDCDGLTTANCNARADATYQPVTTYLMPDSRPLAAEATQYFVIPLPSSRFDYRSAGIAPGNVGAVIYAGKLIYALFADVGPDSRIGEASYATAVALGIDPDPDRGGVGAGVTYIVFPGQFPDTVTTTAINQIGAVAAAAFARA